MDPKGKVALITGGAAGLGYAMAEELLKNEIMGIVLVDINSENGEKACAILSKEFGKERVIFVKANVTNEQEYEDAFQKAIFVYGQLDIVINNAGILNDPEYETMININLTGVVRGTILGLKYMGKDVGGQGGVVLNMSSGAALRYQNKMPVYAATKAGVLNLVRGFGHHSHYERTRVRVLALCPGVTNTSLIRSLYVYGDSEKLRQICVSMVNQEPDVVGRTAVDMIKKAESGSAWIIDNNKVFRIKIQELEEVTEELHLT